MPQKNHDVVVIGAGIIGLSTAMHLARSRPGLRICVLEKENRVAAHQSGHNSNVIHSGIYYKPGSLKAKLCVAGAAAMYDFCAEHGIPVRRCGKVVVATSESEIPNLQTLYERGTANGVAGMRLIGPEELRELEPHAAGIRALHVPGSGITDFAQVTAKYAQLLADTSSEVLLGAAVQEIRRQKDDIFIRTRAGEIQTRLLVNCAGLHSDRVARMAGCDPGVRIVPFRGEYYSLKPERSSLVRTLIYPVPDPRFPFLGVHFTTRIDGTVEAGPNAVLAFNREGYAKSDFLLGDALETLAYSGFWRMALKYWRNGIGEMYRSWNRGAFVHALQRLLPEIRESDLAAGGSGVRAQAMDPTGKLLDDFHIVRDGNCVHVLNVPSPAATASLAIGAHIAETILKF